MFFICIFSCKKYGHGYIKGTVYETGSELPIEGATVIIQHWKSNCGSCSYLYDSVFTDSQGKFIFYFKRQINHEYQLYLRDNNHYGLKEEITQKKNDLAFHLDPFAYLKVRLNKTSNSNNSCSCYDENIWYYHHDGSPIDTTFSNVTRVRGNKNFSFEYTVHYYPVPTTGPEYTSYSNNIYINKGDTLTHMVTYN